MSGPRFVPVIVNETFRELSRIAELEAIEAETPKPLEDIRTWMPDGTYHVRKAGS